MVQVRIVDRPAFTMVGKKIWIEGTDSGQFGRFWQRCHENGLLQQLGAIGQQPGAQTGGMSIGVSCVERDPSIRNFFFMVAVECPAGIQTQDIEQYTVLPAKWAVFQNAGDMPGALVDAEMFAFMQWLPSSGYRHAMAPEMEVYLPMPDTGETLVEFWLPIS
jgi:AraC family transcriptional regulator